jgi:hypothetical protein
MKTITLCLLVVLLLFGVTTFSNAQTQIANAKKDNNCTSEGCDGDYTCDLPNDVKGCIHSNHHNIGVGDGCSGKVVPGKHTADYLRGYGEGQIECHSR